MFPFFLFTVTAKTVGATRDEAKVLNYGRIYGAGVKFASQYLQDCNPKISMAEAKQLANKMYSQTKGDRCYVLNKFGALCFYLNDKQSSEQDYLDFVNFKVTEREMYELINERYKLSLLLKPLKSLDDNLILSPEGVELAVNNEIEHSENDVISIKNLKKLFGEVGNVQRRNVSFTEIKNSRKELSKSKFWNDGSESHTFNKLEEIALNPNTKTPGIVNFGSCIHQIALTI